MLSRSNHQFAKSPSHQMRTAVLLSGGLDSAVLIAEEAARAAAFIQPIYVGVGLAWEAAERQAVATLLARPPLPGRVRPLVPLTVPMLGVDSATHSAARA